ncbi:MAG TPA: hypothetical protein VM638_06630, partial [Actinomycetota bacterium]|nr:hypothetical protein [Actinomycetota bacterium]
RSGEGPRVRLERLAGDATAVFRRAGGGWTEIPPEEGLERGADACVEALLDETVFVALRVFLGAEGCGPV